MSASERCRACGGALSPAFDGIVLGDVPVTYHRCQRCGSLMLLEPHWLERAYSTVIVPDPDFGALRRTLFIDRFVQRLERTGLVPAGYRLLDYGSGMGTLVRLARDRRVDAFGYDLYATPRFAEQYCQKELPPGPFDLITCIEVIEHTTNPVEVLRGFRSHLRDSGILALSTELVDGQADPSKWHYLAPEHGQHITIFSRAGLTAAASAADLEWITSFELDSVPFLHLFCPKGKRPAAWRLWLLAARQARG